MGFSGSGVGPEGWCFQHLPGTAGLGTTLWGPASWIIEDYSYCRLLLWPQELRPTQPQVPASSPSPLVCCSLWVGPISLSEGDSRECTPPGFPEPRLTNMGTGATGPHPCPFVLLGSSSVRTAPAMSPYDPRFIPCAVTNRLHRRSHQAAGLRRSEGTQPTSLPIGYLASLLRGRDQHLQWHGRPWLLFTSWTLCSSSF